MKRVFVILLVVVLLFSGCGAAKPVAGGPEKLTEDRVLFYPAESFNERQGELLSIKDVEAAWNELLFPRSHCYDELFAGNEQLLRMLDYCFAKGYMGFSVLPGTLDVDLTPQQFRALRFIYRVDYGKVLAHQGGGEGAYDTVRFEAREGHRIDTLQYFTEGLEAVREIAKEAPKDLGDYGTALWVFNYLKEHVSYGDRDRYYYTDGHQLYDALVEGTTVCSGFADAMYFLCNALGVDCLETEGLCYSDRDGGLDGHVWNLVQMDGEWYYCDPTWNTTAGNAEVPRFFALSEQALYMLNMDQRTGESRDDTMIPASEHCYDPAAHWNGTPEGAVKSWLWFYDHAAQEPMYLIPVLDLLDEEVSAEGPDAEGYMTATIPFEKFSGKVAGFMTEDCFESWFGKSYRDNGGQLSFSSNPMGGAVWSLESLKEDGESYKAVLASKDGTKSEANVTLEKYGEGYRVSSFELLP